MIRRVTEAQSAARSLGMSVVPLEVRMPVDFDNAFAAMTKDRSDALLTVVDAFTLQNRKRIVDFAAAHRIAAMYETREFVDSGGLISYGPSLADNYRRAAVYVDKISRGPSRGPPRGAADEVRASHQPRNRAHLGSPFRPACSSGSTRSSIETVQLLSTRSS
jgi:hypothetical protein